jgi:hypothetical protein
MSDDVAYIFGQDSERLLILFLRITLVVLLCVAAGVLAFDGLWIANIFFTVDPTRFAGGVELARVSKAVLNVLNGIVISYMSLAIVFVMIWRTDQPVIQTP